MKCNKMFLLLRIKKKNICLENNYKKKFFQCLDKKFV